MVTRVQDTQDHQDPGGPECWVAVLLVLQPIVQH